MLYDHFLTYEVDWRLMYTKFKNMTFMDISDVYKSYSYYQMYNLEPYKDRNHLSSIKKTTVLISAVAQNNVAVLKIHLNSSKWYQVKDANGNNLLQIAIILHKKEAFDYLLSLDEYPIDHANEDGSTALTMALTGMIHWYLNDYFASELLKKGVSHDSFRYRKDTLLHYAIRRRFLKVTKVLLEMGVDLTSRDEEGLTPLWVALHIRDKSMLTEFVSALLAYGADPTARSPIEQYNMFESAVLLDHPPLVQEMLFYHSFDEHSRPRIYFEVFLKLAERDSPLFDQMIRMVYRVMLGEDTVKYYALLLKVNRDKLITLIEIFGPLIDRVVLMATGAPLLLLEHEKENLSLMDEYGLKNVAYFLSRFDSIVLIENLLGIGATQDTINDTIYFLMSYGMTIHDYLLQVIYQRYGHCELFKICLHMDITEVYTRKGFRYVMPVFMYNINFTVKEYLEHAYFFSKDDVHLLLHHFSDPLLRIYCGVSIAEVKRTSLIPHLAEMARDIFRSYLIQRFNVKTTAQFYTLINALLISPGHKKILTYEAGLYY